jgi:hypothetical protein
MDTEKIISAAEELLVEKFKFLDEAHTQCLKEQKKFNYSDMEGIFYLHKFAQLQKKIEELEAKIK